MISVPINVDLQTARQTDANHALMAMRILTVCLCIMHILPLYISDKKVSADIINGQSACKCMSYAWGLMVRLHIPAACS